MKQLLLITTTCLCLILVSCRKDRLTKATETGAGTFSCKVDGKVFLPRKGNSLSSVDPIFVDNSQMDGFTVSGRQNNGLNAFSYSISIVMPHLAQTGMYELARYPYGEYRVEVSGGARYHTDASHPGTVTITRCDLTNRIYSGTFAFTAVDDSTSKVVKITDGRFDVKWQR